MMGSALFSFVALPRATWYPYLDLANALQSIIRLKGERKAAL